MNIRFIKNGNPITSENWESSWMPKKAEQWKDGRSSKELAKLCQRDSFKLLISKVLLECNIEEQDFDCEPESKSSLGAGFGRGGCRNHDLLMIGKNCVIGIEAKVSEPFDKKFYMVLSEQMKNHFDETKSTRAYKLKEHLTKGKNANDIGYQLFTATRGTINAAISTKRRKCIFLVLVFEGNVIKENNYNIKVKNNNIDFNNFRKATGTDKGPATYEGIECWIKKEIVRI